MLTFVIGDIHGCRDLLVDLLGRIDSEAGGVPDRLICLGDYIDRGPDSAGVIAVLRERQARDGADRVICLKGNHEDMLLRAHQGPDTMAHWVRNGGRETLLSFGGRRLEDIPADVMSWLDGCRLMFDDGRHCFVHAGLNPVFPIDQQRDHDLMWIREEFLDSNHDFGRYVVHGHTPVRNGRPDIRPTRVNLDTAAVYGGRLTAAVFSDMADEPLGFLQSP